MDSSEIDFAKVVIVGEFTNENGPFAGDYFVVLIDRDGRYWEVEFLERAKAVLAELEAKRGIVFETKLANSTTFASRIVYPESLKERPLFEFRKRREFRNIFHWLIRLGIGTVDQDFTPEVKDYIAAQKAAVTSP